MTTFADAETTLQGFRTTTDSTSDRVKQYDRYRKAAIFVAALVPLVLIISASMSVICNKGRAMMGILAWVLVFLSILVWICIGVHVGIGKALSDVCWEVELAQAEGEAGVLAVLIQCQTDTSPLTSLRNEMRYGIGNATQEACNTLEPTCTSATPQPGPVDCQPIPWTCNETSIDDWLDFNMTDSALQCSDNSYVDPRDSCPGSSTPVGIVNNTLLVRDCPTGCNNPRFRDLANQGVSGVQTLHDYYGLRDQLIPLLNCQFVADAFSQAKNSVCNHFENALTLVFTGGALEAIGMGLAMATLVHCFMGLSGPKNAYNPRDTL